MASRFDEDYLLGYTKYQRHFDRWAKKSECLLGEIAQCGIIEVDSNGHAYIATHRPDVGEEFLSTHCYKYQSNWGYIVGLQRNEFIVDGYYLNNQDGAFREGFKHFWFTWREIVNKDVQRIYFFASDNCGIHNAFVNKMALVKTLVKEFKASTGKILNFYREHKIDMASVKEDYFISSCESEALEREKANLLLQEVGILNKDSLISHREWQCFELYSIGKSANETGKILGISNRTVETHFNNLKEKLNVSKKTELREIIE